MRALLLVLVALLSVPALAQDGNDVSEASLVADVASVAPGDAFDLALQIDLAEGWHVYWINPGDSGLPVTVTWDAPEGVTVGPLQFPYPALYELAGIASYAHEGAPRFLARVAVPAGFTGDTLPIEVSARWLVCADVCIPAEGTARLAVPVGETVRTGALDDAREQLPADGAGWSAAAASDDGAYVLTVQPPAGWGGTLAGATFFVEANGVVDHAAPQTFQPEGGAWAVRLAASPYASAPAERLRGVLVAAEGETLPSGRRAVWLDAAVAGGSAAAASDPGASGGLRWGSALGFAFLGGIILNLMPCVFPILSIKILGFVGGRGGDPATLRRHGLLFGAGVVLSFLALAGVLLALRAAGAGLGWGFQLQSPVVVAALAVLMTGIALNLLGVFEVGGGLATAGASLDRRDGPVGAFLSGVLATVVASPCTAPFMGAALGYAVAQPPAAALSVFGALGVGMALPYVLLSFRPSWLEQLPRPGPWMETLKQALAFPLFATAVWLVWVFGRQTGVDGAGALLLALVFVGLAAWIWGRWPRHGAPHRARTTARAFALGAVVAAASLVVVASGTMADGGVPAAQAATADGWAPFDAGDVEARVASGEPVFIDFTAAWCLTCQVNKKTTLGADAVRTAFADRGVTTVRADWTNRDPEITAWLDRFGRSGVPLYVLYPGSEAPPVVLPEVLTTSLVLDALDGVGAPTAAR